MTQQNCNPSNPSNPNDNPLGNNPKKEDIKPISPTGIDITIPGSTKDGNIKPSTETGGNTGGTGAGGTGAGGTGGSGGGGGAGGAGGGTGGGGSGSGTSNVPYGSKNKNVKEKEKKKEDTEEDSYNCSQSDEDYSQVDNGEDQLAKPHGEDATEEKECESKFPPRKIFPFNKVKETESGHLMEIDDSPGSERLSITHRTGTGIEVEPMGSMHTTVVRDSWTSVYRDAHVHIDGYTHATLDKGFKVVINKDEIENTEEKSINFDISVNGKSNVNLLVKGGNINIRVKSGDVNLLVDDGDINIRQENGNYNHFVNGNYNLEVMGNMHTVIKGDELREIGGNRETDIANNDELHVRNKLTFDCGESVFAIGGSQSVTIGGNRRTSISGIDFIYIERDKQERVMQNYYVNASGIMNLYSNSILNLTSNSKIEISSSQLESCPIYAPSYLPGATPASGLAVDVIKDNYYRIYNVSQSLPPTLSKKRDN